MPDTLSLSLSAIVKTEYGGTTVNVLNPPFGGDISVEADPSMYTVTLAASASAVSIIPPNVASGDVLIFLPIFNDQAGSLSYSVDINCTVTGPTTNSFTIAILGSIKVPASMTELTADNNDTANSVRLQILHFRRSS